MSYNPERSVMRRVGLPAAGAAVALAATGLSFEMTDRSQNENKTKSEQAHEQYLGNLAVDSCAIATPRGCKPPITTEPDPTPSRMTPTPESTPEPKRERRVEAAPQPTATAEKTASDSRNTQRASRSRRQVQPDVKGDSLYAAFERLAECESSGDWDINTGNGFYGGIQFMDETWDSIGGGRYASRPDLATKDQQIAMGIKLYKMYGDEQWPVCGDRAGLPD
jgi:type IV secretory pathway VirB10-like protein